MRQKVALALMFIGLSLIVFSQNRTLRGTVTSGQDGQPIPGVTVFIVGSSSGANTDSNGNFSIPFNGTSGKIQFSFIGMKTMTVNITSSTVYNVALQQEVAALEEVVVTALGITRQKKALGYSTQDVSGEMLKRTNETNIVNSLAGKASGVYVQSSSGNVGSSSRITIRGNSSLRDANQPLFVVDGIPIDNSLVRLTSGTMYSTDLGNSAADINPSDIAEMSVLKGANASALYGSRGANGVVLITTKSGAKKGFSITVESATTFSKPSSLPDYQNQYGQGNLGKYWYKDGLNGGAYDGVDESTGPKLDYTVKPEDIQQGGDLYWTVQAGIPQTPGSILALPQFNSPIDPATGKRIPTPWISHPDNVKDFFVTGFTTVNSVALGKGGDWGSIRLSLTNSTQKGTLPNTDQTKRTLSVSNITKLTNKLSFEVRASYMNIHSDNSTGAGYSSNNPLMQTIWGGRQVDWAWMKDNYKSPNGSQITWISRYHDNPYWMMNKSLVPSTKNRLIGNVSLKYVFNDWLNLQVRAGNDFSHEIAEVKRPYGSVNLQEGTYEVYNLVKSEVNADFLLSARKAISSNFTISGNLGGNLMNSKNETQGTFVAKLVVPDVYAVSNAKELPTTSFNKSEREMQSLYGFFTAEYKNQLFFELTGRNDWSSTLPPDNRSYFYPSATLSWIPTETLKLNKEIFSYGKLRLGWAQVGNDASPYQLDQTYNAALPFGTSPSFSLNTTLPPLDLKSELITSREIGTDLKFFSNRVGLDVTVYFSSAKNQILRSTITPASGYGAALINAGRIDNNGVEITLTGTPVKKKDFSWDISINWSKNKNKVVELNDQIQSYKLYSIPKIDVVAPVGGEYGTMMGTGYVYDANGNITVGANGIPLTSPVKALGNIMPDWMGGINNTLTYKDFSFGFLIDGKKGGDIFSRTNWNGWQTGVLANSVGPNAKGVEIREPVAKGGGVNFGGVFADGTPNNIYLEYETARNNQFAIGERWTFDASYIKLREMIFSYSLPASLLRKLQIKAVDVSVFGRNLALLYSNLPNVDPEASLTSSDLSAQGGEHASVPPNRSIGFSLKLTF